MQKLQKRNSFGGTYSLTKLKGREFLQFRFMQAASINQFGIVLQI